MINIPHIDLLPFEPISFRIPRELNTTQKVMLVTRRLMEWLTLGVLSSIMIWKPEKAILAVGSALLYCSVAAAIFELMSVIARLYVRYDFPINSNTREQHEHTSLHPSADRPANMIQG